MVPRGPCSPIPQFGSSCRNVNQFVALPCRRTNKKLETFSFLFFSSISVSLSAPLFASPRFHPAAGRRRCGQEQEAQRRGAPETCASGGATAPARHLRHKQASWAPRPPAEPVDSRRCRQRTRREVRAARPRSCPPRRRRRRHHAGARRAKRSSASGRCGRTRRRTLRWRRRSGATCRHGPTSGPSAMT